MNKLLDAIRRLRAARLLAIAGIAGACAACASPPVVSGAAAVPVHAVVSDPIAGIAQIVTADVQQGIADLVAAGAGGPNAPLPLADSLTCGNWLLTAIPQAQQISGGIIPSFQAKGAYSLFIEGKIAAYHIKGLVGSAQTTFIDTFNHNCGAAVAGDLNAINQLLLKVGISVIPGGGVASGILGGILPAVGL
jgi:hypothetical protein